MTQREDKRNAGFYQRLYRDIVKGYTVFDFKNEKIYIKHLGNIDLGDLQDEDKRLYDKAQTEGLLTEKEKIELLIDQDIWEKENEKRLEDLLKQIDTFKGLIRKFVVARQKIQYRKRIEETQKIIDEINTEREELLGYTCEKYVIKHISRQYLKYSLFSDKEFKIHFLTDEMYDDMSDGDLDTITLIYNLLMQEVSTENMQMVAAYPWHLNTFMLCKGSPYIFFGKPVVKLTNYQIELFTHASRYKSVLDTGKSPAEELYKDIQAVVDWYESMLGEKITAKGAKGDGGTIMGATTAEMRGMAGGDDREVISLTRELAKSGKKTLGIRELADIHGL